MTTNSLNISASAGFPLNRYNNFVSFTPVITGSTVAGVGTYTTQFGRYTRIGNMVFITAQIVWTAHTGTGNMTLTSLPFTVSNTTSYAPAAQLHTANINFPAGTIQIIGLFVINTTTMTLNTTRDNNTSLNIAMDAAGSVFVNGYYLTT